jgi:hypothetical protein
MLRGHLLKGTFPVRLRQIPCSAKKYSLFERAGNFTPPNHPGMGFNRRKMEDERRRLAEKEAAGRRATNAQLLEDANRSL